MEGICEVAIQGGEEWVLFENDFDDELTPDIIQFLSKYERIYFGDDLSHLTPVWEQD